MSVILGMLHTFGYGTAFISLCLAQPLLVFAVYALNGLMILCVQRSQSAVEITGIPVCEFGFQVHKKLVECFAYQLFHTGFVHADPHPGNGNPHLKELDIDSRYYLTNFICTGILKNRLLKQQTEIMEENFNFLGNY